MSIPEGLEKRAKEIRIVTTTAEENLAKVVGVANERFLREMLRNPEIRQLVEKILKESLS